MSLWYIAQSICFAPVITNVKDISILPWGLRDRDLLQVPINLLCYSLIDAISLFPSLSGGRCFGFHGEGLSSADLPPEPTLPVETAGAAEEEATVLVRKQKWQAVGWGGLRFRLSGQMLPFSILVSSWLPTM